MSTIRRKIGLAWFKIRAHGRAFILPVLLFLCTLFYYFGELVDWAKWDALRQQFFYGIHDVHRLLFLAPIIYAGYFGRVRGAVIITLVSLMIFLPRAILISPYPDPLLRMMFFVLFAGAIGVLTGVVRNVLEQRKKLESLLRTERDNTLKILDGMGDGVLITGPDFKVRFVNSIMRKDFGEGIGIACHKYLYNLDSPCGQACELPHVLSGEIKSCKYSLADGTAYEVLALPYTDSDGVVCQLATFRKITHKGG